MSALHDVACPSGATWAMSPTPLTGHRGSSVDDAGRTRGGGDTSWCGYASTQNFAVAATTAGSAWDENRYYGIRDFVNGGYDGLIRWRLRDGGLTLYYLSMQG